MLPVHVRMCIYIYIHADIHICTHARRRDKESERDREKEREFPSQAPAVREYLRLASSSWACPKASAC